jgi:hypothetical protein
VVSRVVFSSIELVSCMMLGGEGVDENCYFCSNLRIEFDLNSAEDCVSDLPLFTKQTP